MPNAKTKLQLVQALAVNADLGDEPVVTVEGPGLSSGTVQLSQWVDEAWNAIQTRQNWRWQRRQWKLDLVAGQAVYAFGDFRDVTDGSENAPAIGRFDAWIVTNDPRPRYYRTETSRRSGYMTWLSWSLYLSEYKDTRFAGGQQPVYLTVTPQDRIAVTPTPTETSAPMFYIEGEYYLGPQVLRNDEDVPEMPGQYHDLIVYEALMKYGFNDAANELIERSGVDMADLVGALADKQGPRIKMPSPLA